MSLATHLYRCCCKTSLTDAVLLEASRSRTTGLKCFTLTVAPATLQGQNAQRQDQVHELLTGASVIVCRDHEGNISPHSLLTTSTTRGSGVAPLAWFPLKGIETSVDASWKSKMLFTAPVPSQIYARVPGGSERTP